MKALLFQTVTECTNNFFFAIIDDLPSALCHCLLSYDEKEESFYIIPFGGVSIDNKFYNGIENADDVISDFFAKPPNDIEKYGNDHFL